MRASKVFKDGPGESWEGFTTSVLRCPICGFEYQHIGRAYSINGKDNYEAGWGGRGCLTVIPVSGECGCKWELCFGEHKGIVSAFTRIIELCVQKK